MAVAIQSNSGSNGRQTTSGRQQVEGQRVSDTRRSKQDNDKTKVVRWFARDAVGLLKVLSYHASFYPVLPDTDFSSGGSKGRAGGDLVTNRAT